MSATNAKTGDTGNWQPCPEGELSRVALRLLGRHRRRRLAQMVAAAVALVAIAGSACWQFGPRMPGPEGFNYGGITCAEMHRLAPAVQTGTLDDATLARFRKHVELCPHCKSFGKLLSNPPQTGQIPGNDPNGPRRSRHLATR
ncbi:MAG TPA: zf-HC2 domain-containing protein [Planctomycetaceae bacterium]